MTTHTAITDYFAGATLDAGSLLCHRTTDATIATASVTNEISANGGVFSVEFEGVTAGKYRLKLLASGVVVATRDVEFAGTDAEVTETGYAVLNSATQGQIDGIESDVHDLSTATALISGTTLPAILEDTGTTLPAQIDSIKTKTDLLVTFPTNFSSLGINDSGHISRVVLVDTTTTNTDLVSAATIATTILTTQMIESYSADGVAPTLAQALFLMQQAFTEFVITGTGISVKKLDGVTEAAAYTMDSATTPTQRLRTS